MQNAFLALHLSILLAGWTGVFGKLIALSAYMVVFWRVVIGGSVLLAIIVMTKKLQVVSRHDKLAYLALGA